MSFFRFRCFLSSLISFHLQFQRCDFSLNVKFSQTQIRKIHKMFRNIVHYRWNIVISLPVNWKKEFFSSLSATLVRKSECENKICVLFYCFSWNSFLFFSIRDVIASNDIVKCKWNWKYSWTSGNSRASKGKMRSDRAHFVRNVVQLLKFLRQERDNATLRLIISISSFH